MNSAQPGEGRIGVGILGAGRVGGDLVHKLAERPESMELLLVADTDASAIGLRSARSLGIPHSHHGIDAILADPAIQLVFDASTTAAHSEHAPCLRRAGKRMIDLTASALGPCVVPLVNLGRHLDGDDLSLGSAAAQAIVPVARGLSWLSPFVYAEAVSVLASASVGPGARQDIDEAATATARALEDLGGARQAKAITILSPAEPPVPMRITFRAVPERPVDEQAVAEAVAEAVDSLAALLPGYRLTSAPRLDPKDTPWGKRTTIVLRVEVTGAGALLGPYAGNLDVMSATASALGAEVAGRLVHSEPVAVPS
jgi:acetaldehyde dehydrogenase